jgi:hypothetical protein
MLQVEHLEKVYAIGRHVVASGEEDRHFRRWSTLRTTCSILINLWKPMICESA